MQAPKIAVILLTLSLVGFAGCAAPAPETNATTGIDEQPEPTGNETALPAVLNNTAPEAVIGVEGLEAFNGTVNVTAPALLNFTLNGTDVDGDNITWSFAVNGTETFNGTELPAVANHTFEMAGLFNVTFTVSDGVNATVAQLVLNVTLGEIAFVPTSVLVQDAGGDGSEFAEILSVQADNDGETLVVVLTLSDVWPSTDVLSAATYSVNVNGHLFNSFVRYAIDSNPMTWDVSEGAYLPGGSSIWTSKTVTFHLPISYLEGTSVMGPHQVFATANYGALNTREVMDRAPDAGAALLE